MPPKPGRSYDFVVVGGGIAGLSSAYHLLRDGYSVCLLERYDGHHGASSDSTAITSHDPDAKWPLVLSRFGLKGARELWGLSDLSLRLLTAYARRVDPNFAMRRVPTYIFSSSASRDGDLRKLEAMYRRFGAKPKFISDGPSLHSEFHSALMLPGEGQTNNLALVANLRSSVRELGGTILVNRPVARVVSRGGGAEVMTEQGEVFHGRQAIIATGTATVPAGVPVRTKIMRTFVVSFKKHGMPELFRSSVLWDTLEPYHYIRSFRGYLLWVGGEDVEEKDYNPKKDYYAPLVKFAEARLGLDRSYKVFAKWTGTFYPTATHLPYISKVPGKPVFLNLGFGGTGILSSFVSGYLIASWLKGKETRYKRFFSYGGKS